MEEILSDLNSISIKKAIKENLYAFFRSFQNSSTAFTATKEHEFYWHTPIENIWFNGLLSSDNPGDNAIETINQTISFFRSYNVSSFSWWLSPNLDQSIWSEHLESFGFQYNNDTPGMALDLTNLPSQSQSTVNVEYVTDHITLSEWVKTFVQGYGLPENMATHFFNLYADLGTNLPFRHYYYKLDDETVATSTLFLGAGVAGIYNVATLPKARGLGIGSLMTIAPLYEARKMGFRAGILQSSKMGFSVYQKLGFEQLCQIDHFSWYEKIKASES